MSQTQRKGHIDSDILLSTMLSAMDERIVIVDRAGYIEALSDSYAEFLGVSPRQAVGRHITEVIENTRMHIVIQTGIPEIGDTQIIKGEKMIASRIPIVKDGEILGAFGRVLVRNISDLQAFYKKLSSMEMELNLYKRAFERSNTARYSLDDIIGDSPAMRELKAIVRRVSDTESSVLILGESGTGKELFAHAIHQAGTGDRSRAPFVAVNCSTMPPELMESELFGYVEGAFTGARRGGKQGLFQAANGGTLFLDEIGDLPLTLQPKLLRVLQEREVRKVGSNVWEPVHVRIIAATNQNLYQLVQEQRFRADLYYRLNIVSLHIPALRERREDIPLLARALAQKIGRRNNVPVRGFSRSAMTQLTLHSWPGNVRELENVLERAINFIGEDRVIRRENLPARICGELSAESRPLKTLAQTLEEAERQALIRALRYSGNSKTKAAQALGISRTTLYDKLSRHKLAGHSNDLI